ncbi:adenylate/guanylate cyclase domain-containing protein [Leptospira selangorensis]|uniref:Adenylate/guanylate cyclase domain-containing protein n=1 Tax=Leptospira selangorensis TaxID=2484982 RepID=A0A5F2C742_9LEPT|nr:adenylate/guanylate cyclase domain-containing protein [Leptospira selangorensis]TGM12867.1 adenylate/guanylate cyclase domain-containing protein [Leptospira selangorensis]TGM30928.1 adenylate/guanylate cyclase domain-containing protein [Leptospira selangorensis]
MKSLKVIPLILFLVLTLFSCRSKNSSKISPLAENGVLDLREWNFAEDGIVKLDGEWKFQWMKLAVSRPDLGSKDAATHIVNIPGNWNQIPKLEGMNPLMAFGYGTYTLKIIPGQNQGRLMMHFQGAGTAASIYLDGKKIMGNGVVGPDANSSRPQYLPLYVSIGQPNKEMLLQVEISNFDHYKGGLWESLRMGTEVDLLNFRDNSSFSEMFLFGSIIIMALYHFGLYSLRRRDMTGLFFGAFCASICLRIFVTGERFLILKFPHLPWEFFNKLEYISFYLAVPFFIYYLDALYPHSLSAKLKRIFIGFNLVVSAIVVFTPASIYTHTLIPFQVCLIFVILWIFFVLVRLVRSGAEGSLMALGGVIALTAAAINDSLYSQAVINTGYYLPLGLFVFIFVQSYLLSFRFSQAFLYIERLSDNLLEVNKAYSRFVPLAFLKFLNKNDITEIGLGDQVQREMTILFSDIRSFTQLSEKMTPKDNFDFLNSYMRKMGPIIRKHGGFIDKYLGDGIMALFPSLPDQALDAAMEMLRELESLNQSRADRHYEPIQIGIGLHTGTLMLGTIGEEERMDGTVISDAVNLASRIEGLTKEFHANLLLSESTYRKLKNRRKYSFKKLGKVKVKGKSKSSEVYEVLG